MKPAFKVTANGQDITARLLGAAGVAITITDAAGIESDTVTIDVDDENGSLGEIATGAVLLVWIGYWPALAFMGQYVVDEVTYDGFPQKVSITGHAADQTKTLKERRTETYRDTTAGAVFSTLAGRNGLTASVDPSIASQAITDPPVYQEEESDQAFASRLAKTYNATATIKNGQLVVVARGAGTSASGASLGVYQITRPGNLLSYRVAVRDKAKHEKVEATWFDRQSKELMVEEAPASGEGPVYRIREPLANAEEARKAAVTRAGELVRGERTATFEVLGDPVAVAEMLVSCAGARAIVDGTWSAERVEHRIDEGGFITTIACKVPGSESAE